MLSKIDVMLLETFLLEVVEGAIPLTRYGIQCTTKCQDNGYYWCGVPGGSYDYCSPSEGYTIYNKKCRSDHSCNYYGYDYMWCYKEDGSWDYCSKIVAAWCDPIISESNAFCLDECDKRGYNYNWCKTAYYSWDYCEPNYDSHGRRLMPSDTGVKVEKDFDVPNGCTCTGIEGGHSRGQTRTFIVACSEPRKKNEKIGALCRVKGIGVPLPIGNIVPQRWNGSMCTYEGNPHRCSDYNKKQYAFYNELLNIINQEICSKKFDSCPTDTFSTRKICPEIGFRFSYQGG